MSGRDLDPILPPDAVISFYDAHRPALKSGDYRLSKTLTVKAERLGPHKKPITTEETINGGKFQNFSVAGPRFSLGPEVIHSTFPPDQSTGNFAHVLPHVALKRATLPWERSAYLKEDAASPPWLAVIVLQPGDILKTRVVDVKSALADVGLTPESSDDLGHDNAATAQKVTLITLAKTTAQAALPDLANLRLLSHVRKVAFKADGTDVQAEMSMVVASRMPASEQGVAKTSVAHLVSVEGLYKKASKGPNLPDDPVHLVSLTSWTFTSYQPRPGFKDLLQHIANEDGKKRLGKSAPDTAAPDIVALLENGWTMMPHRLRTGETTYSWYHGPLVGDRRSLPKVKLPSEISNSDVLTLLDPNHGLMDIAYSSAWELGRLLISARPNIARGLAKWKRQDDFHSHANRAQKAAARLPHGVTPPSAAQFDALELFFRTDLAALGSVPFRYLVPDGDMLPLESIRFFDVDPVWIQALMDGAFSVGRSTTKSLRDDASRAHVLPKVVAKAGFLLRSSVVKSYRGLQFDGYSSVIHDKSHTQTPNGVVRAERLGPNTLLVLFDSPLRTLDLHLHAQAMHFDLGDKAPSQTKRQIEFAGVADSLKIPQADLNSATLARKLVRGVPLIRIVREAAI